MRKKQFLLRHELLVISTADADVGVSCMSAQLPAHLLINIVYSLKNFWFYLNIQTGIFALTPVYQYLGLNKPKSLRVSAWSDST
jgi:hypothetical protein